MLISVCAMLKQAIGCAMPGNPANLRTALHCLLCALHCHMVASERAAIKTVQT